MNQHQSHQHSQQQQQQQQHLQKQNQQLQQQKQIQQQQQQNDFQRHQHQQREHSQQLQQQQLAHQLRVQLEQQLQLQNTQRSQQVQQEQDNCHQPLKQGYQQNVLHQNHPHSQQNEGSHMQSQHALQQQQQQLQQQKQQQHLQQQQYHHHQQQQQYYYQQNFQPIQRQCPSNNQGNVLQKQLHQFPDHLSSFSCKPSQPKSNQEIQRIVPQNTTQTTSDHQRTVPVSLHSFMPLPQSSQKQQPTAQRIEEGHTVAQGLQAHRPVHQVLQGQSQTNEHTNSQQHTGNENFLSDEQSIQQQQLNLLHKKDHFSTLPSSVSRPVPVQRRLGHRPPIRRQNSFSGFPSSSVGGFGPTNTPPTGGPNLVPLTNPLPSRMIGLSHPMSGSAGMGAPSHFSSPPVGSNIIAIRERSGRTAVGNDSQGVKVMESFLSQPQRSSLSTTVDNSINNTRTTITSESSKVSTIHHSHGIINVRNNLSSSCKNSTNNSVTISRSELTVVSSASSATNHYANAINSLNDNKAPINTNINTSNASKLISCNSSLPMSTSGSVATFASAGTTSRTNERRSEHKEPSSHPDVTSITAVCDSLPSPSSSKRREIRTGPGIFYSLPRHATASSNPSLMRASASGLGLYFMSRRDTTPTSKESAAKQLGVSIPSGSNKFRSLPRPSCKNQVNIAKSQGYLSLPRPSRVLSTITMLSLPPSEKTTSNTSKIHPLGGSKKLGREQRENGEGKENVDIKTSRKRDIDQVSYKPLYKDIDMKYQSLPRRKDVDLKHLSLPKKIPKELKDIDAKYQSLPKKKSKELDQKYQSLPKRTVRDGESRHASSSRRGKDSESRHSSSKRSSSRESDGRPNKKDSRSPPGYNKVITKRSSDPPRSPRWIPTDSDEDEMYSSIKSRDDSSHQSSVPETPYSRPLPPLPVPSRYRRRTADKDGSSPPLPPPRLPTGSQSSHNSLPIYVSQAPPTDPTASHPIMDDGIRTIPGEQLSMGTSQAYPQNLPQHTKIDYSNDSGYHPPPPRIPPSKVSSTSRMSDLYLGRDPANVNKSVILPFRESPQGGSYPQTGSTDQMRRVPQSTSMNFPLPNYPLPGSALTLPYPGSHGASHNYRGMPASNSVMERQLPPGATYPRNHSTRLMYTDMSSEQRGMKQYPAHNMSRSIPATTMSSSIPSSYRFHYLDMYNQGSQGKSTHSGLPSTAIPLPGLSAGFTPGGFASSRAMFTGIPRDSVTGIPPPLDPPPKIPYSEPNQGSFPIVSRADESPLYASDPLYEVPQIPHMPGGAPMFSNQAAHDKYLRSQNQQSSHVVGNRRYDDSRTPSPDNMLTRTEPSGEEDHYSSIPSLMSTTPETPSTLPRGSWPNRVANSASWDSLGSSGFSSMGSSQGLSGNTSSSRESAAARRRRRARSDPRMDAGVLNRLAFSVCNTGINFEKEVKNWFRWCVLLSSKGWFAKCYRSLCGTDRLEGLSVQKYAVVIGLTGG